MKNVKINLILLTGSAVALNLFYFTEHWKWNSLSSLTMILLIFLVSFVVNHRTEKSVEGTARIIAAGIALGILIRTLIDTYFMTVSHNLLGLEILIYGGLSFVVAILGGWFTVLYKSLVNLSNT